MKKLLLLTKTLLAVALLCVGQNAWGDLTVLNPTGTAQLSLAENSTTATSWLANQADVRNSGDYIGTFTTNNVVITKFDASSTLSDKSLTKAELKFHSVCTAASKNSNLWAAVLNNVSWAVTDVSSGNINVKNFADYNKKVLIGNASSSGADLTLDVTSWLNSDDDKVIGFGIYTATGREQQITNITLEVTYSSETLYTATFTENNELNPNVTIYSDAGRTTSVLNGTLADKTTYYYRAVLESYNDYEGSFTVDGANPSVNFTMTAKPRYTFTVNLVNNDGGAVLQTIYTDEDSYDGKTQDVSYPLYLTGEGNAVTYVSTDGSYYKSYTSSSADATKTIPFTAYTGEAYFFEGEDVAGATEYTTNTFRPRSSSGATGVLSAATVKTLDAGVYRITARSIGKGGNTHSMYKTSTSGEKIFDITTSTSGATGSSVIYLEDPTAIVADGGYYTTSDNGHGFDYILIEKISSVSATIGSYGYATFSSAYDLDFTTPISGLTAYKAASATSSTVTLEEVTGKVKAGDGLVIKGAAGTYSIPVTTGASTIYTDQSTINMWGYNGNETETVSKAGSGTNFVLSVQDEQVVFAPINGTSATLNPGQAALWTAISINEARALRFSFGDVTGVENVEAAEAKAQDGKFIENGKLVIVKNGQKFNAAGQQVK